jgi:hypothetical protein
VRWWLAVALGFGCGRIGFNARGDGGGSSDGGGGDATPACTSWSAFSTPTIISGPIEYPTTDNWHPSPALGQLALYFSSFRAGGLGAEDIWVGVRTSLGVEFDAATDVTALNTAGVEGKPTVTEDALDIVFSRGNPGQLFEAMRGNMADPFSSPVPVDFVASSDDEGPWLSADGLRLWFVSTRDGNGTHLFEATRASRTSPFAVAGHPELEAGTNNDLLEALSADGLEIYLSSTRPGGPGGYDVYTAQRPALDQPFSTPVLVPELSSPGDDDVSRLSPDGATMYMDYNTKNAGGSNAQLMWATRTCQ